MEFAFLPPEVNSGRIYAGPGSGSMLTAADAWASIAAELYLAASAYGSVVCALAGGPWLGASSTSMAAAAASFVAWIRSTAAQAEETAAQATAAAVAYEVAFAGSVPPEVVAANRSLLMSLVATNLLGQNTPAIAVTEAEYGEMWAQDVAAMYGYAGEAATATRITPFSSPRQTADLAGLADRAHAVGTAASVSSGTARDAVIQAARMFSAIPDRLSNFASKGLSPIDLFDLGADLITYVIDAPMGPLAAVSLPLDVVGAQTGLHTDDIVTAWRDEGVISGMKEASSSVTVKVSEGAVSAGVGEANAVGSLSVPPTWTAATPAVRPVALAMPTSVGVAGQQMVAAGSSDALTNLALASTAGRALTDRVGVRERVRQPAVVCAVAPREDPEKTGGDPAPRTAVTGIAAEIREFAKLRDEGLITEEQFIQQRNRLLDL
ncbi:PPE family protein, SVP subgroup [Mycobacterium camsae]|uniref:PPE family protein, SVP subgroup n=1 Tax=Mycobacterium gordonae TaxID=1778 RepID=UPI00197F14B0|nr:PPE domain-containing protein [Mycobacterium gordonae]